MDFCQLLHKAQKNDKSTTSGARYYSTKFEPPKKIKKESKDLSENIKKFLAKKEAEEQKKREEDNKKKDELLALRAQDKKATRRVNVMLKRTKSANQSVLEEAVDNTHTAVTRAGPEQPDEDDYGYVSQEASALYEKMMEKYSQMPEEPKFNMFKKKVSTNLSSTKDRVKAALEKEREEAMQPHRRKRKKKNEDGQEVEEKDDEGGNSPEQESKDKEVAVVPKPKPKPRPAAPPPLSFTELLKIAAQKQHEPIMVEEKPQEEEKLYTKKQRKEMEKEKEWREKRERRLMEMENRDRQRDREEKEKARSSSSSKPILKNSSSSSGESKILERELTKPNSNSSRPPNKEKDKDKPMNNRPSDREKDRIPSKQVRFSNSNQKPSSDSFKKPSSVDNKPSKLSSSGNTSSALKTQENSHRNGDFKQSKLNHSSSTGNSRPSLSNGSHKPSMPPRAPTSSKDGAKKDLVSKKGAPAQVASGKFSGKPKEFPPRDLLPKGKPKEFPPRDLKPKQFPPPDVRGVKRKKPMVASRGRIMDDDDEEEYDSELDDFIDDGDEEGDYSSYIKEIFGYDKSRYRGLDDDVDDMETSFAQQMKEEVISTKIGIMEDLEDMKKEEEEKRRKALMKKKMKR